MENKTTTTAAEPSMDEVRAMLSDPAPEPKAEATETGPKPDAAEVETEHVETKDTETESAPVETKQPEEVEEELPPNVQKKIAKEVARTAAAQRAIDEAVSKRKEAEDKLAKLNGKPGSEPAPTTEPAKDGEPVEPELTEPDLDDFASFGEYQAALKTARTAHREAMKDYRAKYAAWLTKETEKTVEQKLTAQYREAENKKAWTAAVKAYPEFPKMAELVAAEAPDDLQTYISAMPDWDAVTVHLGKHPEDLKAVSSAFKENPIAAVAQIGALMERTKQVAKPPVKQEPAERPPAKVGLGATPGAKKKLEDLPTEEFAAEFKQLIA